MTSGIGLKELCDRFQAENDDYNAIMAEAIADRLAEASPNACTSGCGMNGVMGAKKA